MSPVDNVGDKSTCPSKSSSPRPLAEPMFEVYDSGSWSCFNCNSEFSKLESIGRHLYTCLDLLRSPVSKNSDEAGKAVKTVSTRPVSPPYRCSFCSKVFKRKYHLEVHTRLHTGVKPYQCGLCARKFHQQSALNWHKNHSCKFLKLNSKPRSGKYTATSSTRTGNTNPYSCKTYPKVFKNKISLTPSSRIHSGHKPYSCSLCSSTFKYPTSLRIHQLCHRNLRQFVCPICKTGFDSHGNLRKHTPKHSRGIPSDSTDVKCTRCSTIFRTNAALIQHVKTHARYKKFKNSIERPNYKAGNTPAASKNSNGSSARSTKMNSSGTTTADSVKCDICPKSFNSQSTLSRHLRVHGGGVNVKQKTDVELHSCKICSKVLSDKPSLARHARIHSGIKPYKCNLCTAKFLYPQGLTYHKLTHSNLKQFACTICKVGFNNSSNLYRHYRSFHYPVTPTNLKLNVTSIPIPTRKSKPSENASMSSSSTTCSVCSKVFTRKANLSSHMRLHTGEKPFECIMCEAKFANQSALRNHNYMHSSPQFVCDICQTSFIHPASLKKHVPKHTNGIPDKSKGSVRCIRCSKLFSSNLSLITHMKQHSGK